MDQFQLFFRDRPAGPVRGSWEEAARDAVAAGLATWVSECPHKAISWTGAGQASIARNADPIPGSEARIDPRRLCSPGAAGPEFGKARGYRIAVPSRARERALEQDGSDGNRPAREPRFRFKMGRALSTAWIAAVRADRALEPGPRHAAPGGTGLDRPAPRSRKHPPNTAAARSSGGRDARPPLAYPLFDRDHMHFSDI